MILLTESEEDKEFEGYKDMNISKITPMWNYIINPSQFGSSLCLLGTGLFANGEL